MNDLPQRDLWYGTRGPHDAPIVLVGESWGAEELAQQRPFVGTSGTELSRILAEAGVTEAQVLFTNVCAEKPYMNEMWRFFHPKREAKIRLNIRDLHPMPNVVAECRRLYRQIYSHERKLIIAVGNYALWALTNCAKPKTKSSSSNRKIPLELQPLEPTGIGNWRGSMWQLEPTHFFDPEGPARPRIPLLPIYHPAAIQRAWTMRAPTVHDLKARVPMALRGDWRPAISPVTLAPPTYWEVCSRLRLWLQTAGPQNPITLTCDLETVRKRFISVCGLTDSTSFAMSIPFIKADLGPEGGFESYWPADQEATIIGLLRRIFLHPHIRVQGQNFIYDIQFIQEWFGVTPRLDFDSMLAQNVLFPGTTKALEYISSLYCRYHWYWKEDHKDWDKLGDIKLLLDYNAIDLLRTHEACEAQRKLIAHLKMEEQMALKMRINDLCLRMMNRGTLVDKKRRHEISHDLMNAVGGLAQELEAIIPQSMVSPGHKTPWYRSDKQTAYLFYDRLGFKTETHRKTKQPTVGKEARQLLAKKYPEFSGLFNRLRMYGSAENTHNVLTAPLESSGRLSCSYNPGGTETHRLSSSKTAFGRGTNLQNLTEGEEDD